MSELRAITGQIEELRRVEAEVEALEAKKKALEQQAEVLACDVIPELLRNAGLSSLKLTDGTEYAIEPVLSVRPPEKNRAEVIAWVEANGGKNLVKTQVSVVFPRDQRNAAEKFLAEKCEGMEAGADAWIESMTLRKFVSDRLKEGKPVPFDLCGVYSKDRIVAVNHKQKKEVFE